LERIRRDRGIGDVSAPWKDPDVYPDMQKAVDRVQRAVAEGEKIGIFGDYDCDGVTSTAQLVRMFRRHGTEPVIRLPHRVRDGYGLQPQHVDEFAAQGINLLLTADTGIAAAEAVERAQERGIDVIILDHHHFSRVPEAFAVIHPALAPNHPEPHPSAAGVVHAFVRAYEKGNPWEDSAIDTVLAAIGTVADLVPLTGGNRLLVQEGLEAVRHLPESPLRSMIDRVCGDGAVTSGDFGWKLAPRINAAGRMDDATDALIALLEGGPALEKLETLNSRRQQETLDAVEHAVQSLGPEESLPPFLCIASAGYGHGIVGLIAGKLTERYNRPSLAACIDGDVCTASLRSPAGYNIVEALERAGDLLTRFGGHAQAAGATFPLDAFMALARRLEEDAAKHIGTSRIAQSLHLDGIIDPQVCDLQLHASIQELAPFGQGNTEPLWMVPNVLLDRVRRVGSASNHLQARAGNLPVIGFGLGHLAGDIANGPVDLACRIGSNTWNGKTEAQLIVTDIRTAQTGASFPSMSNTSVTGTLNAAAIL
jgi:single-stranded-DNA-specific exonuclease